MGDVYYKKPVNKFGTLWDVILLILRFWFGYVMMMNGKVFFELFTPTGDRAFFETLFVGNDMRFPLQLIIAFEAKGAEFFGGLFVFSGLFTRFGAALVALTILVITLTANIGGNKALMAQLQYRFVYLLLYLCIGAAAGTRWMRCLRLPKYHGHSQHAHLIFILIAVLPMGVTIM